MRELVYMLDQFIVIWYRVVFCSRFQEYSNIISDQNTYFFTLLSQTVICTGKRWKCVCVCVFAFVFVLLLLLVGLGSQLVMLDCREPRWESYLHTLKTLSRST